MSDKWQRLGIAFDDVVAALHNAAEISEVHAIASESEAAYARRIAAATGFTVDRYATLEPWKEAIAGARALIAPDSGAVHVAGMLGTPTVAVFPPIVQFALQTARWAPWAAPYRMIRADDQWPREIPAALHALL